MSEKNAAKFAEQTRAGFERKANHNKTEAIWCFRATITCTVVAPIFVSLSSSLFWGKIVPAMLSGVATLIACWLQQRKPQQLWALYRTCQRRIEEHITAFTYGYAGYENVVDSEQLLAREVARIAMFAHEQWMPLVPSPEGGGKLTPPPDQHHIESSNARSNDR